MKNPSVNSQAGTALAIAVLIVTIPIILSAIVVFGAIMWEFLD